MQRRWMGYVAWLVLVSLGGALTDARAEDYRVERLDEAPPSDGLSEAVRATLSDSGIRLIRGTSRTVCDIWLCKQWQVSSLDPGPGLLYPLEQGQLIGVVRFPRKSDDFRVQTIDPGIYTLRYALQPVDGAHVGTSPTRDFLLLVKAADDPQTGAMEYQELVDLSSQAMQTSHPGILSLKKVEGTEYPHIRHVEEDDWWLVRLQSTAKAGDQSKSLAMDVILIGEAKE